MNIQQAKQEIAHTLRAYLHKDETGAYTFPPVRQRPILLMGPPGIGKTAIMAQLAEECGVGLVAYTLTHHTRQSAIGLPHLETRVYDNREVTVTEYTLSEIIASIYETMETSGHREGILFLDEINCVSETLAPTMLQLLQNKTFGSHRVPEGWVIVAAGNPPAFNKSVRDFDVVTLDRVRRIDVEADLGVWLDYAEAQGVHPAILSYLCIKSDHFYRIRLQEEPVTFVTARGWEDLSQLLHSYDLLGLEFGVAQARQLLNDDAVARDFASYEALYRKYGVDYGLGELLTGRMSEKERQEKTRMAQGADFEERFTVVGLVLEQLQKGFRDYAAVDDGMTRLHECLRQLKSRLSAQTPDEWLAAAWQAFRVKEGNALLDRRELLRERQALLRMEELVLELKKRHLRSAEEQLEGLRLLFQEDVDGRKQVIADLDSQLCRAFSWLLDCFGEGAELALFVSRLTRSPLAMDYIARHGCEPYLKYSQVLLYRQRESELREAASELLAPDTGAAE